MIKYNIIMNIISAISSSRVAGVLWGEVPCSVWFCICDDALVFYTYCSRLLTAEDRTGIPGPNSGGHARRCKAILSCHHGRREGCSEYLSSEREWRTTLAPTPSSTKLHEEWAFGGYGQVSARPRIVRIKRAYRRACYRALRHGMAEYRGKLILPADVPWRFRESYRQLPPARKELMPISTAPGIRCMTWNASKALVYAELLIWASAQPLDVLAIQEIGWGFSATWSTSEWHFTHSASKQASVLLMVRTHIAPVDRIATAALLEGRLLHVRVFLKRTTDFLIVYQHAWNASHGS